MNNKNILENLKDAGCEQNFINEFFKYDKKTQLNLLKNHRINLLDRLHESQKQIDCLDYLIFNLNLIEN